MEPVLRLLPDDAVEILGRGKYHGMGGGGSESGGTPFFNPYLLNMTEDRIEFQKLYFKKLFSVAKGFLINSAAGSVDDVQNRIRAIIRGESGL